MSPRTNDGEPEPQQSASGRPAPDSGRPVPGAGLPVPNPGPEPEEASVEESVSGAEPGRTATGDGPPRTIPAAADGDDVPETEAGDTTSAQTPAEPGAEPMKPTAVSGPAKPGLSEPAAVNDPAEPEPTRPAPHEGVDAPGAGELGTADGERVTAVRRVGAAGRRWRAAQLSACAAMLAVALTAGAIALGAVRDGRDVPVSTAAAVSPDCSPVATSTRTSPPSRPISAPSRGTSAAGPPSGSPTSSRPVPRVTPPATRRPSRP